MAFTDPMFQLGMRMTMQFNDRFVEMTAPDYWASYLINGDASGMSDEEIKNADFFIEQNDIVSVIDIVEDSERFTHSYDMYDTRACVSGGTVVDYIVEVKRKETDNG